MLLTREKGANLLGETPAVRSTILPSRLNCIIDVFLAELLFGVPQATTSSTMVVSPDTLMIHPRLLFKHYALEASIRNKFCPLRSWPVTEHVAIRACFRYRFEITER